MAKRIRLTGGGAVPDVDADSSITKVLNATSTTSTTFFFKALPFRLTVYDKDVEGVNCSVTS